MAEIIQSKHEESINALDSKSTSEREKLTSQMYEDLGVLNSLRTLLHFFKLASRPAEENIEELFCLWKLAQNTDVILNNPELKKTVTVNQYHPTSVKVNLGDKFTNWTIA